MLTTLTYLSAVGGIVALIYAIILAVRINKMDSGTKRMKEIGEFVGIPLSDHIIIGDHSYVSFREEQMM